jgi:hypothetical protein
MNLRHTFRNTPRVEALAPAHLNCDNLYVAFPVSSREPRGKARISPGALIPPLGLHREGLDVRSRAAMHAATLSSASIE